LLAVRFEERVNGDVVVHGGKTDLFGVSISIPLLALGVTVDGSPPSGIRSSGSETTFWFDLPAGSSRLVHIDDLGRAHPLESPGRIELR
jgi:hypothetical protein